MRYDYQPRMDKGPSADAALDAAERFYLASDEIAAVLEMCGKQLPNKSEWTDRLLSLDTLLQSAARSFESQLYQAVKKEGLDARRLPNLDSLSLVRNARGNLAKMRKEVRS